MPPFTNILPIFPQRPNVAPAPIAAFNLLLIGQGFGGAPPPSGLLRILSLLLSPSTFRYARNYDDGGPPLADAVSALIQPGVDMWKRSWLYCDHVCCVVHLDALRFAMLRRNNSDAAFNDIPTGASVALIPPLGLVPDNPDDIDTTTILDFVDDNVFRGNNTWFDNIFVRPESFQIGDQLVFWNHAIYTSLFPGAFRLENAIITAVESDPETGGILPLDLQLEGHGMDSVARRKRPNGAHFEIAAPGLANYSHFLKGELNKGMERLQKQALDVEAHDLDAFI